MVDDVFALSELFGRNRDRFERVAKPRESLPQAHGAVDDGARGCISITQATSYLPKKELRFLTQLLDPEPVSVPHPARRWSGLSLNGRQCSCPPSPCRMPWRPSTK
jgi:hypothetical protein